MTQADRDRLVTLKKAKKKLITQAEAAAELQVSVRQVKRMLKALSERGDRAVVHGLRGRESNRKIEDRIRERAVKILSAEVYRGFGPTLAGEHLAKKHGIEVSRETVRKWMQAAGLWRGRRRRPENVHVWRQRRSRCGELVQWDTSDHDWLEGRASERLYLISMIDDATSRLYARFVSSDSTEENMRTLHGYLKLYGRPAAFYTDKASLFKTTEKRRRDEPGVDQDPKDMPPTQIGRALQELNIVWIAAHSPQAKGRVERSFDTAQDRLVKEMRVAGVKTLEEANQYLASEFLPWWNRTLTVKPASGDDAHRKLDKQHDLAAILSHVKTRQVKGSYTVGIDGKRYVIDKGSICAGLRGGTVRVERRLDGTIAIRFKDRYLGFKLCTEPVKTAAAAKPKAAKDSSGKRAPAPRKSAWMDGFWDKPAPSLREAIRIANATS
jgi:transposase